MSRKDVATGIVEITTEGEYATEGPSSSWQIKNEVPPSPPVLCQLWAVGASCTEGQMEALEDGTAVVEGLVVVEPGS